MEQNYQKRSALLSLLVLAFAQGFIESFLREGTDFYRIFKLVVLLLMVIPTMRWFVLDAQEQNYKIPKGLFTALVFMGLLAAPVYFFQTRGKKAAIPILQALLFVLLFCVMALGGFAAAYLTASVVHIPLQTKI